MITVPDPAARSTARYQLDLDFRAAADKAHSQAQSFNATLQALRIPCDFVPESIDVNHIHLADTIGGVIDDY